MTYGVYKPSIPEVVGRFARYLALNPVWGSLHIVLDDSNVEDSSVDFCINWAIQCNDMEGFNLGMILRSMSRTQRLLLPKKAWELLN